MDSSKPDPGLLERIFTGHAALKKKIHAFRMPIQSRFGLFGVGVVYFTVPLVAGYFIMQWSNSIRDANLGTGQRERLLEAKARWNKADNVPQVVMARTPKARVVEAPSREL